jgi:hypothetical protein
VQQGPATLESFQFVLELINLLRGVECHAHRCNWSDELFGAQPLGSRISALGDRRHGSLRFGDGGDKIDLIARLEGFPPTFPANI